MERKTRIANVISNTRIYLSLDYLYRYSLFNAETLLISNLFTTISMSSPMYTVDLRFLRWHVLLEFYYAIRSHGNVLQRWYHYAGSV